MVLKIRQHIELRGKNPLAAMVAGTHYKAYLVTNLAFNDGAQASADHYGIPLANVYGAMAFYCENEGAIKDAMREARELGDRSVQTALEEIRGRQKAR